MRIMVVLACVLLFADNAATQLTSQSDLPAFDAVSIKPNRSGDGGYKREFQPTRFIGINLPVESLLIMAYRVHPDNILNAPKWLADERFDIEATLATPIVADSAAKRGVVQQMMLRRLLTERFGAVVREVSKDTDGYALVIATSGRLGPQLVARTEPCPTEAALEKIDSRRRHDLTCGIRSEESASLRGRGVPLERLAITLGGRLRTIVVNKTALPGLFDFDLKWAPESSVLLSPDAGQLSLADRASIFTSVEEQLGLRLVPQKAFAGAVYVERLERPTPN